MADVFCYGYSCECDDDVNIHGMNLFPSTRWEMMDLLRNIDLTVDNGSPKCRVIQTQAFGELIERFFWQKLTEEALQKLHQPMKIEKYSSEYDSSFNDEEFTFSSAQLKDTKLYKKYPLYKDPPLSYWLQNKQNIQGITTPPDHLQPFKKNTTFSKPLEEILDEPHSE
uniref:Uncharacterized protein n=1 Tax=Timema poppense TaxID=170557 RepID=A0A7R9CIK1_TIMPO|nr:unnamed protein product [Timema poppensis]